MFFIRLAYMKIDFVDGNITPSWFFKLYFAYFFIGFWKTMSFVIYNYALIFRLYFVCFSVRDWLIELLMLVIALKDMLTIFRI